MTQLAVHPEETEPVASRRAAGSSFYFAMRMLPRARRDAMFEIYSFCRYVDDIADSEAPRADRIAALERWRRELDDVYAGRVPPQHRGLAQAIAEFDLRKEDFVAIIEGMEMDAAADIRAPDLATFDLYCDRVASAVGRLSVRAFGMGEPDGEQLAHHLGRALQIVNILRDIDEDAENGRLYLPRELLDEAGITTTEPRAVAAHPGVGQIGQALIERARKHFEAADEIMDRSPRWMVRAPRIMGKVYRAILDDLSARGFDPPREPVKVNKLSLLLIVLQYGFV
ncbi:squalene synthase HpnD [Rhodoplanes elegans]|uniref:Squalene synthase HpnD n=1 Tax=Rhodoplanes elegans TaxID=29408 RepID=A0A327KS88_9BRAD|nr:presqualene diphosphate synthase HpnD [Rhodoplanes elegans]MBK5957311.1 squalene synthase HpnD [Rhodoplanes elegans]RAI41719.1 squalene synthase HpnD [Rhodoplanes elegans]